MHIIQIETIAMKIITKILNYPLSTFTGKLQNKNTFMAENVHILFP